MENNTHEDITSEDFAQLANILGSSGDVTRKPDKLDVLQGELRSLLGESSTFGAPLSVKMPNGNSIVYRQRKPIEKPDVSSDARRAVPKRSAVQKAVHDAWNGTSAKSIISSRSEAGNLVEQFPIAHELVEYVTGGGEISNVSRMVQRKPPEIHDIEDVADSIDWNLLNRGINSEHIETALSKDKKKVILFMDDRAQPRLTSIKEVLAKYGSPRIIQKADDVAEATGQPHGFYVFELEPDITLFRPKTKDDEPGEIDWSGEDAKRVEDSIDYDEEYIILEDIYERYCSTCGEDIFEKSALPTALKKNKSSESFDARVGDPKGKKKKDHPSTLGDSLVCAFCNTEATEINEHKYNGIFCARHGDRLDKYSRACYECKTESLAEANTAIVCPECSSETTMESKGCGVCGIEFAEDVANDFAAHIADSLFADEKDDNIVEHENSWDDPFAAELADTLFPDVEDSEDSFS
jgi:YgiT-type zinc finger domain-containing protein